MPRLVESSTDKQEKRATQLIWGQDKVGKTKLATTLPVSDDREVLYFGADPGELVLRHRSFSTIHSDDGVLDVPFLESVYKYVRGGVAQKRWKFLFTDGLDEVALRVLRAMTDKYKDIRKAYGEMGDFVSDWTKRMRDIRGITPIFVTHLEKEITENGVIFQPLFPGQQIAKSVNGWFDEIGCMRFVQQPDGSQKRMIQFWPDPDPRFRVGDRSGALNHFEEPNLAAILEKIHGAGIETEGEADPPLAEFRTDEEMLALVTKCKELGITGPVVQSKSVELFGKNPRNLDEESFNKLMGILPSLVEKEN